MFSISVCLVWSDLASSGLVWFGLFLLKLRDERDPQPPSITAQSLLDIEISRSQTVEAPLSVSSTGGAQPQTDQPAANPRDGPRKLVELRLCSETIGRFKCVHAQTV